MVKRIRGIVIRGDGIGQKQGYPTANLNWPKKTKLTKGIFAAKVRFDKKNYKGLVVSGILSAIDGKPKLEVYLLDFNKNIYGRWLSATILKKIRNLEKFSSQKALLKTIKSDCKKAREFFKENEIDL